MTATRAVFVDRVTDLSRRLRAAGLATTPATSIDAVRALSVVDAGDRADVYLAFRALFVGRQHDVKRFDEVFAAWWAADLSGVVDGQQRGGPPAQNPPVTAPWEEPKEAKGSTTLTRWASSLAETDG